jgi:arsenate reductase-like glutaredoxin family protein
MKKIYHLGTCDTNRRLLSQWKPGSDVVLQDIKKDRITSDQLDEMKGLAGSYEALFSRTARNYRVRGLSEKELTESDYRELILEDYTFLKRPVVVVGHRIFIGSSSAVTDAAGNALG